MEECGYVAVRNEAAKDGLWKVDGKRQAIYARRRGNASGSPNKGWRTTPVALHAFEVPAHGGRRVRSAARPLLLRLAFALPQKDREEITDFTDYTDRAEVSFLSRAAGVRSGTGEYPAELSIAQVWRLLGREVRPRHEARCEKH
jgi:hypothetical protein